METRPEIVAVSIPGAAYDIRVGTDLLAELPDVVAGLAPRVRNFLLVDSHVAERYGETLRRLWSQRPLEPVILTIPSGEASKSIAMAESLWNALAEHEADRQSLIIAIGGGVVGDLAGFVAATFARGLRFLQVPTTLLAQVDSSVGGKVGINLDTGKNLVGCFWQPSLVLADVAFLDSLPRREYVSGLAEVVKYGVILDEAFFEYLETHVSDLLSRNPATMISVVRRCCELKAQVVVEDERETKGHRVILNYGHTFAHAFETVAGYGAVLHGEAVAMGMHCACELARRLGWVSTALVERQRRLLTRLGLPVNLPDISADACLTAMRKDKKNRDAAIHFVLPRRLGCVVLTRYDALEVVREVIEEAKKPPE